eukprot:CAMPEP_0170538570 /NCGR_PEP_ID=MMETSP0209-20121228/103394_1 /TAXON_ID=665100 ORGANISM="Litonotus pictus, Strain P1" /NCGR_SAMPLE_ID=MMETSP0209 /ASSEMBLY_ACC=CAM_ASM_000301 /LENGTH=434 /DNA_ID=CAMNT_0010840295 /DNA_START=509 /DNA_END=1810 /DNA_ORIENTATION=+
MSEVTGVLHSKLLVFDNTVIVTGANLSENYFTQRLDRYWVFQQHEPFADYCEDYINALSFNAYKYNYFGKEGNEELTLNNSDVKENHRVALKESFQHQLKMHKYDHRVKIPNNVALGIEDYFSNLDQYNNNYIKRIPEQRLLDFKTSRKNFIEEIQEDQSDNKEFIEFKKRVMEEENKEYKKNSQKAGSNEGKEEENVMAEQKNQRNDTREKGTQSNEVYVFPSFQFKATNIDDDEKLLYGLIQNKLFTKENEQDSVEEIRISTGYFNPPGKLVDLLRSSTIKTKILTSSPQANSFYGAKGIKKHVPFFYKNKLLSICKDNVEGFEYKKNDWSFHCKGFWFFNKRTGLPLLSILGSSNYNQRSFTRDIESQFYVYSESDYFGRLVKEEVEEIFNDSERIHKTSKTSSSDGIGSLTEVKEIKTPGRLSITQFLLR